MSYSSAVVLRDWFWLYIPTRSLMTSNYCARFTLFFVLLLAGAILRGGVLGEILLAPYLLWFLFAGQCAGFSLVEWFLLCPVLTVSDDIVKAGSSFWGVGGLWVHVGWMRTSFPILSRLHAPPIYITDSRDVSDQISVGVSGKRRKRSFFLMFRKESFLCARRDHSSTGFFFLFSPWGRAGAWCTVYTTQPNFLLEHTPAVPFGYLKPITLK